MCFLDFDCNLLHIKIFLYFNHDMDIFQTVPRPELASCIKPNNVFYIGVQRKMISDRHWEYIPYHQNNRPG